MSSLFIRHGATARGYSGDRCHEQQGFVTCSYCKLGKDEHKLLGILAGQDERILFNAGLASLMTLDYDGLLK